DVDPVCLSTHTSFQNVRHLQGTADLTKVLFAPVRHHACATDDLELGNLGQLGQNVVLHSISEKVTSLIITEIRKRQNLDAGRRGGLNQVGFQNDYPNRRDQSG